jgi:hypothetical protein
MPSFFHAASDQLEYLDPEPDRWRSRELESMDQAFSYDHYLDFENVPAGALDAPDRWEYLRRLYQAGLARPERDAGFLPYRILELYQRLVTEWRLWRQATGVERRWIEERIVNDAGILGHYVTDAAQPHHTTIHFNGWNDRAPNPRGYTTERDFHARFESDFVSAHVRFAHVLESFGQVEPLYRLEQAARFDPGAPPPREHLEFAAARLAAGAGMLRDLWWSAWVESGRTPSPGGR